MNIKIITDKISLTKLKELTKNDLLGEMIKAVVDINKGIMAIGGEWHSDAELALFNADSRQDYLTTFALMARKYLI
jgi:hypothetical protein